MTIYHETTFNYDAPAQDRAYAQEIGVPQMQPYIDAGYCSDTEFYWTPSNPVPGEGLFTIRRKWSDYDKMQEWIAITVNSRNADPILAEVASEAIGHNDDNYQPPA